MGKLCSMLVVLLALVPGSARAADPTLSRVTVAAAPEAAEVEAGMLITIVEGTLFSRESPCGAPTGSLYEALVGGELGSTVRGVVIWGDDLSGRYRVRGVQTSGDIDCLTLVRIPRRQAAHE